MAWHFSASTALAMSAPVLATLALKVLDLIVTFPVFSLSKNRLPDP